MRGLWGIVCLAALPVPLVAEEVAAFGQVVRYGLPAGFVPAFASPLGPGATHYLEEAVPAGEDLEGWSQMVTLVALPDGAAMGLEGVAQQVAQLYAQACPGSLSAIALTPPAIAGAEAAAAVWLGCGTVAGGATSEAMVMIAGLRGPMIWALQWAERGAAVAEAPTLDPAAWGPRVDQLAAGMVLCGAAC